MSDAEHRLLALAPAGGDAALTQQILARAGVQTIICDSVEMICREAEAGVGGVLLDQEALVPAAMDCLLAMLRRQPPWSDLPIMILMGDATPLPLAPGVVEALGNVVLLERPLREATLISTVRMALRGRRRQYEIREHLHERERRETALHLLAHASERLADSLAYEMTLERVAHLAVPGFANWCAVDLVESDGSFRRMAVAAGPAVPGSSGGEQHVAGESLYEAATLLRSAEPKLYAQISGADDADHLRLLYEQGIRSAIVVPLVAHLTPLGVVTFGRTDPAHAYAEGDVELATALAHRAALAIDNASLHRELEAAVQIRDRFLSIASHELRTPLTSLLGYTSLLQRGLTGNELAPAVQRALRTISLQATRLNLLIEQLLDVSRLQRGQFTITEQPLDFGELVARVVDEFGAIVAPRPVSFTQRSGPIVVRGDTLRLEQVLQNLLGNAVKYSPAGGPVEVSLDREAQEAILEVRDTGVGIPAAAQPHLFEPYYRSSATSSRISGFGIGLFVVREIVARHGGRTEVESTEGQGSTFRVRLPLLLPTPNGALMGVPQPEPLAAPLLS
jgi:signal transduction histidine kinase